jgi:hypothetical protein
VGGPDVRLNSHLMTYGQKEEQTLRQCSVKKGCMGNKHCTCTVQ